MGLDCACRWVQWQLSDVNLSSNCLFSFLSRPENNQQSLCQHSPAAAGAKWEPYLNCWIVSQNWRAKWGQILSWPRDLLQHWKSFLTPAEWEHTFSFHKFTDKMFCSLQEEAQLVENQTCSLSGLHKTTLVWLTLWFSKSDSLDLIWSNLIWFFGIWSLWKVVFDQLFETGWNGASKSVFSFTAS